MHPVLIKIGPVSIYTYGLFVALGFLVGILVAQKEAVRLGQAPARVGDLCFYILIAAIIGSRLFYMAVNPGEFMENPLEIFKIWNGGLVFYGGFIAAVVTMVVYLRRKRLPLWQTTDILAPGLAAGHVLGRIGCFFAGCCYGKACALPWAVTFTDPMSLAPHGIPIHPTQLYEVINNLILFSFLWWFRKRKTFDGQVFWVYLLLYGVTRTLLEIFRGDPRGLFLDGLLSISQIIGMALAAIAVAMLIYKPGHRPVKTAGRNA
ncbi:MAG: prolipoprotein diacylglyceryl transferase [Desulfobacterales bacterium]|jgi:phosphatidylglycerol:prolipoprotein diacylglycerol transferase|nr:prolipoprotein diacylglyceryl transferase [Desulfobacterales bacterium]